MKLSDLIEALANEIDIMQPQLEEIIYNLSLVLASPEKASFTELLELLDSYKDYISRLGEASEMIDFIGIKQLCDKVEENILLLATANRDGSDSNNLFLFLKEWIVLLANFLHQLNEQSLANLLDRFCTAPLALTDNERNEIEGLLLEIIKQAEEGAIFEDEENERITEVTIEDVNLQLPADIDQHLMDGFLQEAPDMANGLVSWAKDVAQGAEIVLADLQQAKRYTHTLKGTGATIGARGLASVGHHLEDILEYLEENPQHANAYIKNLLLDSAYCLEQMVGYIAQTDDNPEQAFFILQQLLDVTNKIYQGESLDELQLVTDTMATMPTPTEPVKQAPTSNAPKAQPKAKAKVSTLRIPVKRIDDLFRVSGEISIHSSAMEDKIKLLTKQTQELLEQNLRVQKRLFELETLVDVRALNAMRHHSHTTDSHATENDDKHTQVFDPLELNQYNELYSSAHALFEESADVREFSHMIEEQIASLSSMQSRQQVLSRDLQHLVMNTRMSEVGELESRLQRNIRTTGQMTGKSVNLHMTGQDTLIDSDLIGKLADPLLHLLRNAVDHGIETSEERQSKGKDAFGNIYLDFFRQGQQVVLRCQDDGGGLNLEKIHAHALAQGLITEQQVLSDEEIAQLIFKSGFSSRDDVSEISGRGVGLDVVRDWAVQMNGSASVTTGDYGGCLFELRFSASLSTIQSLIVSASDNAYFALPAIQVEQAISHDVGKFSYQNDKLTYFYEGEYFTAYLLAELVGLPVNNDKELAHYNAVIVTVDNKRYAFAVDDLIDSRELLVTPAGRFAKHLQGVSGLSILGNGAIAVNLDLSQLIVTASGQKFKQNHTQNKSNNQQTVQQIPKVLIVDDALTVRNGLQQFVEDMGLEAYTAKDGLEAVTLVTEIQPTLVITDMEMPNMNGIELTQYLRQAEATKELPIIMITSRSQEKHREVAQEVGVNDYITKPYSDDKLLASIKQFL